ncbi:MAG: UTP--glucose-1-phosphate uridylyltransferase [Anaerolineae bacterium]|jgi:UTP--glucose-1-phosphate uridylyltransferase|nr:UTP--glucose-1-phosphate uridylyltransferase [Anaerolineae bacterium]MDH7474270.1 UTP--glucose-1-phosphate uridylyltransferase [Anaerolineae bacterium]
MRKVRKAVIPAAGWGTRFLPITKAVPKEMLPIVDRPVIHYVVEEAVRAGIEEIVIVTARHKRAIEEYFDRFFELEQRLLQAGKDEEYAQVRHISEMAHLVYVHQAEPLGNGHAVLCARRVIGDEPFLVLWGDDFIRADPIRACQLVAVYEEYGASVLSLMHFGPQEIIRVAMASVRQERDNVYRILSLVEKPRPEQIVSDLGAVSGWLLTPGIFPVLETIKPGQGGEIWLPEAISALAQREPVYGCEIRNGIFYDAGNPLAYLKANLDLALARPEMRKELLVYLRQLLDTFPF